MWTVFFSDLCSSVLSSNNHAHADRTPNTNYTSDHIWYCYSMLKTTLWKLKSPISMKYFRDKDPSEPARVASAGFHGTVQKFQISQEKLLPLLPLERPWPRQFGDQIGCAHCIVLHCQKLRDQYNLHQNKTYSVNWGYISTSCEVLNISNLWYISCGEISLRYIMYANGGTFRSAFPNVWLLWFSHGTESIFRKHCYPQLTNYQLFVTALFQLFGHFNFSE